MFNLIKRKNLILPNFIFVIFLMSLSLNSKATNFSNIEEKIKPNLLISKNLNNKFIGNQYIIGPGDTIIVPKSNDPIKDQVLAMQRSNLSPENIDVFISRHPRAGGSKIMKRGSSLNYAIATAGGKKLLTGEIEFIRFGYEGKTQKSSFKDDLHADIDTKKILY